MEPSEDTALVSRRRQLRVSSVDVTDPLSRTSSRSMPHVGSIEEEPTGEPEKKPEESEKKPEEVEKKSTSITELMQLTCYLDNTGSVARDHLANERTFLAWVRTAMVFVTFAIGVVQFYRLEFKAIQSQLELDGSTFNSITQGERHRLFHALSKPIALMFIILGGLSLIFGTFRYYQVQLYMIHNTFPVARFSLVLLVVLLFAILVILTVLDIRLTLT